MNKDKINGKIVNDLAPTIQLKTHHPIVTAATKLTMPLIYEQIKTQNIIFLAYTLRSKENIVTEATAAANLDTKKDIGTTNKYAIIVFTSSDSSLMYNNQYSKFDFPYSIQVYEKCFCMSR